MALNTYVAGQIAAGLFTGATVFVGLYTSAGEINAFGYTRVPAVLSVSGSNITANAPVNWVAIGDFGVVQAVGIHADTGEVLASTTIAPTQITANSNFAISQLSFQVNSQTTGANALGALLPYGTLSGPFVTAALGYTPQRQFTVDVGAYGAQVDNATDDTAAWRAAVAAATAAGGGRITSKAGTSKVTGAITISASNIVLDCPGVVLRPVGSMTAPLVIVGQGVTATATLASAATMAATSISLSSLAGIAAGGHVYINKSVPGISGAQGVYSLLTRVRSVTGSGPYTVTLESPLPFSIAPGDAGQQVLPVNLIENVGVIGLRVVGDLSTGNQHGIYAAWIARSRFSNVTFASFPNGAGLYAQFGLNNTFSDLESEKSGNANNDAIFLISQSGMTASNLRSFSDTGFGVQVQSCAYSSVSNVVSTGSGTAGGGRGFKVASSLYCNFANLSGHSAAYNGIGVSIGTSYCNFNNLTATGNTNLEGVWLSDQLNRYNVFSNVISKGNSPRDIFVGTTDGFNTFFGVVADNITNLSPFTNIYGRNGGIDTSNCVSVEAYGAVGDTSFDDYPAFQAAANASNGRPIMLGNKSYRITQTVTGSYPVSFIGVGCGAGPGGALQDTNAGPATRIYCDFANPTAFSFTTTQQCIFANLQINVMPAYRSPAAGAGIAINAGSGSNTNANTKITNCAFNNLWRGIYALKPSWWTIQGNYFGTWKQDAITSETDGSAEASLGYVKHNYFFGNTDASQRSCVYLNHGYTIISENEILGGQVGVRQAVSNYPAGFLRVINNTIEEQYYYGTSFEAAGTFDATMLDVSGNEFSVVDNFASHLTSIYVSDSANRKWLQDVTIRGNTMRHMGSVPVGFMRIGAGENMVISENVAENIGTIPAALMIGVVGVSNNNCLGSNNIVADNIGKGTFTTRYSFATQASPALRDPLAMTYASIPANCADGSQVYCSDRDPWLNTGSGTPLAKANGVWTGAVLPMTSGGAFVPPQKPGVGAERWFGGDNSTSNIWVNVPTGGYHRHAVNNSGILTVSASGVDVTRLSTVGAPSSVWQIDMTGGATNSVTLAASATFDLPVGSGIVTITNDQSGEIATFLCGQGIVYKLGGASNLVVSGTPPAGNIGLFFNSGTVTYRIVNGYSTSQRIYISLMRTRASV